MEYSQTCTKGHILKVTTCLMGQLYICILSSGQGTVLLTQNLNLHNYYLINS